MHCSVVFLVVFATIFSTAHGFLFSASPAQRARGPRSFGFDTGLRASTTASSSNNHGINTNSLLLPSAAGTQRRTRRDFVGSSFCGFVTSLLVAGPMSAGASSDGRGDINSSSSSPVSRAGGSSLAQTTIAYRTLSLPVEEFGTEVPVSIWYPIPGGGGDEGSSDPSLLPEARYRYKISLRRIGQLLARWDFIPEFVSKEFSLAPSAASSAIRVVDGEGIPIASASTIKAGASGSGLVFLAHGFLGSRSDLGYIAEDLASRGFVCVAAEYPESLEASYPRADGLDRDAINRRLVPFVEGVVQQPIASHSAIGHSLGCGTVLSIGDESWNRVLMGSGRAPESPSMKNEMVPGNRNRAPVAGGRLLFISSVNDGPVNSWGGGIAIPDGYSRLEESGLSSESSETTALPGGSSGRLALVFDRDDAPNHISYLSENVNDAMLSFLSPLLPVTKALGIPVLDFDKYADSRDSVPTGEVLKPLIARFLAAAP
eukprot:CAMPEP_0201119194 /NCGR_PEP_ID=MMETSP0850-20130426/3362_1 /ASSEMBLY_ACC=CAM_ASM_000622 /TAXON_ID=183588 /ORGANISM="Pseudo-nitzschia fraudulenta, Strain WWA7" /LENGTH=485 /DNA_ID=CAMNT_0047384815 /DNA_START=40 /DNA_END=1497 /DNA_ORIENTATION=+